MPRYRAASATYSSPLVFPSARHRPPVSPRHLPACPSFPKRSEKKKSDVNRRSLHQRAAGAPGRLDDEEFVHHTTTTARRLMRMRERKGVRFGELTSVFCRAWFARARTPKVNHASSAQCCLLSNSFLHSLFRGREAKQKPGPIPKRTRA